MPRVEVFCPARLEAGSRTVLVTIRDISQGGVKIEAPFTATPEDRVLIAPEGLRPIEGIVRWAHGNVAGIGFEPELAWQELMPWLRARRDAATADFGVPPAPIASQDTVEAEPEREGSVQLTLPARVREGTHRWSIDVASLSARSVEFDCFSALRLGTLLWIVLPGLEGWPARIVGIDGYRFTCEFTQPLHPAVLERILATAKTASN
jgi:hypothetical protein